MSRLGFKSLVYHGDVRLGELDAIPVADQNFQFPNNEIRINHISQISERCPPLAILQTICSFSVRCKLESSLLVEQPHLINLHASCFHESKTAVVVVGDEEIHLVAMPSKLKKFPCFWCYAVPAGLYTPCVGLLNLRCLAIVFDLDETLIVANTMKSFEDRIEALRLWTARETDPIRQSGMSGELKRYVDDRMLLKQYVENDSVVDNGKAYKVQMEEVPSLSENFEKMFRPVIRLVEKNIVLTRINPEIRDTSVLVRLRPAWDDLRSYLTAKGRKRFEVYVCTMAERDYALEMWRLLDPGAHLIAGKQLLNRVVCVKSGLRKSLLNVFQERMCLPKMAMVIDDRAKVWEEKDQTRVHVVPAFTPYYAPQAEMASAVPVLCVARNVACNVRGYFFKEFDENLLRQIVEISYEDDVGNLPPAPDVSNYLMTEDAAFASNGNANGSTPFGEGMNGVEVERRLDKPDDKCAMDSAFNYMSSDSNLRADSSHVISSIPDSTGPVSSRNLLPSQKPGLLGAPIKRDLSGDRDYDMKRGLLAMKPGLDFRNQNLSEHLLGRVPTQMSSSLVKGQGGWLVDEDINKVNPYNQNSGFVQEADAAKLDKLRTQQNSPSHGTLGSAPTNSLSHGAQMKNEEVCVVNDMPKQSLPLAGVLLSQNQSSTSNRDFQTEAGKGNVLSSPLYIGVLQEIARRCNSKVEFRSVVSTSKDLQFSVEVLFTGEKIGIGMGKTRKDAQLQAAENGLRSLAEKYVAYVRPHSEAMDVDFDKVSRGTENGFLWDTVPPGVNDLQEEDGLPKERTSVAADEHDFTSKVVNQQGNKNAKFSELPRTDSSKRLKRELFHVLLDQSSSGQVENGHLSLEYR